MRWACSDWQQRSRAGGDSPDAAGRIQAVQNGTTLTNFASLDYNAAGAMSTLTLANGITEQLAWTTACSSPG